MSKEGLIRVARTYVFTCLGLLIPGLLGWINAVTEWARAEGQKPFPDATSLAYLLVVAITAAFPAAVNALVVLLEDTTGKGLGRAVTPKAKRPQVGMGDPLFLTMVAMLVGALFLAPVSTWVTSTLLLGAFGAAGAAKARRAGLFRRQ